MSEDRKVRTSKITEGHVVETEETWEGTCSVCEGTYVYKKKFLDKRPMSNTDTGQHAYKSQCEYIKRDNKRKTMKQGKRKHLRFVVPFFPQEREMSHCAKNASKYRKYVFAESSEEMDCKKCYWQLFKLDLMTQELHEQMRDEGRLHPRFMEWERWSMIA